MKSSVTDLFGLAVHSANSAAPAILSSSDLHAMGNGKRVH